MTRQTSMQGGRQFYQLAILGSCEPNDSQKGTGICIDGSIGTNSLGGAKAIACALLKFCPDDYWFTIGKLNNKGKLDKVLTGRIQNSVPTFGTGYGTIKYIEWEDD